MTTAQKTRKITFTREEQEALERLRRHSLPDLEQFTAKEFARLEFLRWRLATGQLQP